MARNQHTLQHNWHNVIIQGHKNSKSNTYRTAQNRHRLLMLLGWSPSSPCNQLLTQYRRLMTRPISKSKERHTITRPVNCRAWVTIRCAGEEREGFERRDLWRGERSDAAVSALRCSIDNGGQQRDEDKATSQHCVPLLRGWGPKIGSARNHSMANIAIYDLLVNVTRTKCRSYGNKRHTRPSVWLSKYSWPGWILEAKKCNKRILTLWDVI